MITASNPYIGPRSFQPGEILYGRERELRQLTDRLLSERIVLLHSPSGAGKTSLVQAGLIPQLRAEGFFVHRVVRINLERPAALTGTNPTVNFNRYTFSTLLSLEEHFPEEQHLELSSLEDLNLDDYLKLRAHDEGRDGSPEFLIFDQFEEALTIDPAGRDAKIAFFARLGVALKNRNRWALFAMREDYLGALEPYVRAVPTYFANTYRLDLLGVNAAREAVQRPARAAGVDFTDDAAGKLVDDLRRTQVQLPDGSLENILGLYIEPVQLQVVCYRLWETQPEGDGDITPDDLKDVGNVDQSLSGYFALSIEKVARETGVSERSIREWFETKLITSEGLRGQVLRGSRGSDGLANQAVDMLENTHLIRAEKRAGVTWFELAHDRLIDPIRNNNKAWFEANLKPFQRQAALWDQQGRGEGLLLRGSDLSQAEKGSKTIFLSQDEQEFLRASVALRQRFQRERWRTQLMGILALGATAAMIVALVFFNQARSSALVAQSASTRAVAQQLTAQVAASIAEHEKANAEQQANIANARELAALAVASLDSDPELSLNLALQSIDDFYTKQGEDVLRRGLLPPPVKLTLQGHSGQVYSVAYSSSGQRLLTASADGTARIWDAASGRELLELRGHTGAVNSAVFSPDDRLIATAGADKSVRIWNADNGQLLRILIENPENINTINFSPDGRRLLTSSADHTARVWDVGSGSQIFVLSHDAEVRAAVFSPFGTYIATGGYDQTIKIWNAATGELIKSLSNINNVESLAFSSDQKYLLASRDFSAVRWDIQAEQVVNQYSGQHSWYLASVAFSPDGRQVITTSRDHTVGIWDTESGTSIELLRGHSGIVYAAAFDPGGDHLATASEDGTVRIWNMAEWRKRVLVGSSFLIRAIYSSDGRRIVTAGSDVKIRVWDAQSGRELKVWLYPGVFAGYQYIVNHLHYSPDNRQLIFSSDDGTWGIWDADTGSEIFHSQPSGFIITDARFNQDGTRILTTSRDGSATIWDSAKITDPQRLMVLQPKSAIWSGSFSPDGHLVVTVGTDEKVWIWVTQTGQPLHILSGHGDLVVSAAFNSTGSRIVTASVDGTARIWDIATGQLLHILRAHIGEVKDAAFSPDGQLVATASRDNSVILWNAETGEQVIQLFGHSGVVASVEFSPDGRYLLTASLDGTARVFPVHIEDVLAQARSVTSPHQWTCQERNKYLHEEQACPTPAPIFTPTP